MKQNYTVDALIEARAVQDPNGIAFYRETREGYKPVTAQQFCIEKRALAKALEDLGITRGDTVGILSSVRYEWELAEKAALSIGCASFGIDTRHSANEIADEIEAASIDAIVVENESLYTHIPNSFKRPIILIEPLSSKQTGGHVFLLETLIKQNIGHAPSLAASNEDWAVIISTSGTTGKPKLIRYRNRHIVAACLSAVEFLKLDKETAHEKKTICWLPLVYMTSKEMNLVDYVARGSVYFLKNPKEIMSAIQTINPSHFLSVPIFYERMYKGFQDKLASLSAQKRLGLHLILAIRRYTGWKIAQGTVRSIRQQLMGKCLQYTVSGSAPLSPEVIRYFRDLDIDIYQAYAMSENAIPVAMNTPYANKIGSVGKVLPRQQVRIAPDGEILVLGDGVFEGYIGHETERGDLFTSDGYLKTGDIGSFDEEGYLFITGRKKSIIKTANGYRISPAEIESVYETDPYISQIVIVGDNQKYIGALIVPDLATLQEYFKKEGVDLPTQPQKIVRDARVHECIASVLKKYQDQLAIYKQVKVFRLLPERFSVERGEVTENFKLKRAVISKQYAKEIATMFKEGE